MAANATETLKKIFKWATVTDYDRIVSLLEKGANPNVRNANKQSLLEYACWYGIPSIAEAALRAGAKVNADKGRALLMTVESDAETGADHRLKPLDRVSGRGNFLNVFVCPDCKTQSIVRQST
jgi:hypothetical protein